MLLLFGTGKTRLDARMLTSETPCDHCQQENTYGAITESTYFHIFWIPILPISKETVVVCQHCKKAYHEKELPPYLQKALTQSYEQQPVKHKFWEYFGCLGISAIIAFFVITAVFAIFYNLIKGQPDSPASSDSYYHTEGTAPPENTRSEPVLPLWLQTLEKDRRKANYFPEATEQALEHRIFECLESNLATAKKGDIAYYTKVQDNKILVLVGAFNLESYTGQQRDSFYSRINECLDKVLPSEEQQRYVGIFKGKTYYYQQNNTTQKDTVQTKSPELLRAFYTE